jgi:cytochrome P450
LQYFAGKKWKVHRKILTPSFHFQILEQFLDVFKSNGDILVQRLSSHVNGPKFDITDYFVACTLDVICGKLPLYRHMRCLGPVQVSRDYSAILTKFLRQDYKSVRGKMARNAFL